MGNVLIDAYVYEYEKGNEIGAFTTTSYENITIELNTSFGKKIDKV